MEKITFSGLWQQSRVSLKGQWGGAILACFVQALITNAAGSVPLIGGLACIFLAPLTAGLALYFLKLTRTERPPLETIFEPFNSYGRMLWAAIRMGLLIFLQYLLLIIPGIVATYRYSLTFYVMFDDPTLKARDAMILSREMMYGHKMQLFGYLLLLGLLSIAACIFTLCIGLIWLIPFTQTFMANYYLQVKAQYELQHPQVVNTENI